jgi:hypothetical protein
MCHDTIHTNMVDLQCLFKVSYNSFRDSIPLRRSKCRLRCFAWRYVLLQCGHGNLPFASLTGTGAFFPDDDAVELDTAGLPGALGRIPRRP